MIASASLPPNLFPPLSGASFPSCSNPVSACSFYKHFRFPSLCFFFSSLNCPSFSFFSASDLASSKILSSGVLFFLFDVLFGGLTRFHNLVLPFRFLFLCGNPFFFVGVEILLSVCLFSRLNRDLMSSGLLFLPRWSAPAFFHLLDKNPPKLLDFYDIFFPSFRFFLACVYVLCDFFFLIPGVLFSLFNPPPS